VADQQRGALAVGARDVRPGRAVRCLDLQHLVVGHAPDGARMERMQVPSSDPVRVDKWLWAARLVKTRQLGAEAVKGGRVHINGRAVKPSKDVHPGDRLELSSGPVKITVVVKATAERRGPASLAQQLYDETADSVAGREAYAQQRRLEAQAMAQTPSYYDRGGRPTKRDRRRFESEREGRKN
jgi:ribosome-associated heat shock protein Hsp15